MKPNYDRWRKRLAGETVVAFTQPDENDVGCYRLPVRERKQNAAGQNNGQWQTVDYKPVLLGVLRGELCCQIGSSVVAAEMRDELWTSFVKHPISEEWWRDVAMNGKPWPDLLPADTVPAADREVAKADNAEPEQPPDVQHATAIDNAIAAALKKVTTEAEYAQALGSKNRIAELRLAADKAGKAIYDPIYRQYTAEQKKWSAPVKRAEAKEKELNTELLTFRESERKRIAAEQAEADRKQHEIDEANERAADRAIARGEPEPEPVIVEVQKPAAAPPPAPTYGTRKLKEELHLILDAVTDYDAVYAFLKEEPKVKELLLELATAKVKAGCKVPGTITREGLI